jgi:hypothetical protein
LFSALIRFLTHTTALIYFPEHDYLAVSSRRKTRMENTQESDSGAHGGAVRIVKRYLGKIGEKETIDDVEGACAFAGGDFALEYRGAYVHIWRVVVGVR